MVKAHPAYSGTIMTATFQIARDLGWDYLEKLAKQRVMQVQSSTDPPKKLALGERAVMVDGNDYNRHPAQGGRPAGRGDLSERGHAAGDEPERRVQGGAEPERGAAVPDWMHSREGQQILVDFAAAVFRPRRRWRSPARKLADIKLMKDDPAGVEKMADEIKTRYAKIFGV